MSLSVHLQMYYHVLRTDQSQNVPCCDFPDNPDWLRYACLPDIVGERVGGREREREREREGGRERGGGGRERERERERLRKIINQY